MKKQPSERRYIKDHSNYNIYIIAHIPKKNQCIKFRTFHGTQRKCNIKKAIYAHRTTHNSRFICKSWYQWMLFCWIVNLMFFTVCVFFSWVLMLFVFGEQFPLIITIFCKLFTFYLAWSGKQVYDSDSYFSGMYYILLYNFFIFSFIFNNNSSTYLFIHSYFSINFINFVVAPMCISLLLKITANTYLTLFAFDFE